MIEYPARVQLAQTPTPLVPLTRFCEQQGLPLIWLKRDDLTDSAAGGNKIRKLEFCLAEAQRQEADVLITYGGVQSNHCRATALLGAKLGFKVHLVLRGDEEPADANLMLDYMAGAAISYVPAQEFPTKQADIERDLVKLYANQGLRSYCIPIGASDEVGVWGYIAACAELAKDFKTHNIRPKHIIAATGSGGTQAGLTAGSVAYNLDTTVWGINVCDNEAWFLAKVRQDLDGWLQRYEALIPKDIQARLDNDIINVIDGYVGEGYAKASDEVLNTILTLTRSEGVVLDPVYSGKAFNGFVKELRAGRFGEKDSQVVFVHTGGIFGLYDFKAQLRGLL